MKDCSTYEDTSTLAASLARDTITLLHDAIAFKGHAIWVLAGGSTPNAAYKIIAETYIDAIDWSDVTIALGDERVGPLNSQDNNWTAIDQILLQHIPKATLLRPLVDTTTEKAASEYDTTLNNLLNDPFISKIDVLWLGVGEDGHTLSLFPGNAALNQSNSYVVGVHDSPKPPSVRISLSLAALKRVERCAIIASGSAKSDAIKQARKVGSQLPVALAAASVIQGGGSVHWYLDSEASSLLTDQD